ncbi:MAG: TIGR02646 family protein [Bacteroidetes bacterium 4572_128]|nr:MAG: TIGR02646 family protein [Bacteroidetes bacterium 4572_128]
MKKIAKLKLDKDIKLNLKNKKNEKWSLTKKERKEIESKLFKSQGYLCCYCECEIDTNNKHIEHFYERSDCKEKIYDYDNNLLLSCEGDRNAELNDNISKKNRKENISCGHKKGKTYHKNAKLNYDLLLNPTDEKTFELFLYNDDGTVENSKICDKNEIKKVEYTIKY